MGGPGASRDFSAANDPLRLPNKQDLTATPGENDRPKAIESEAPVPGDEASRLSTQKVAAGGKAVDVTAMLNAILESCGNTSWTQERLLEVYAITQSVPAVAVFARLLTADGFSNEQLEGIWRAANRFEIDLTKFTTDLLSGDRAAQRQLGFQIVRAADDLDEGR